MRSPDQHSRDLRSGLIGTAIAVSAWGFSGIMIKSIDMGAIVAFYFGARETHYFRNRAVASPYAAASGAGEENAALEEWRQG